MINVQTAFGSGSVIGNGGDPIYHFIENTRKAYISTIQDLITNKQLGRVCENTNLEKDKLNFCKYFFKSTYKNILSINIHSKNRAEIKLTNKTLYTKDKYGELIEVSAVAHSIYEGFTSNTITFHRPSIKSNTPFENLLLFSHELGHLVRFKGKILNDNDSYGPFENGRLLLDTLALSISRIAKSQGIIGSDYGLKDNFLCEVSIGNTGFTQRTSSSRIIYSDSFNKYNVGFNRLHLTPHDPGISVIEDKFKNQNLLFVIEIQENNSCVNPDNLSLRSTKLKIIRETITNSMPKYEDLVSEEFLGLNPLCEKKKNILSLSYRDFKFECEYMSTYGESLN